MWNPPGFHVYTNSGLSSWNILTHLEVLKKKSLCLSILPFPNFSIILCVEEANKSLLPFDDDGPAHCEPQTSKYLYYLSFTISFIIRFHKKTIPACLRFCAYITKSPNHHHFPQFNFPLSRMLLHIAVGWSVASWLPNQMISLILIFGFLCRSQIPKKWPTWPPKKSLALKYIDPPFLAKKRVQFGIVWPRQLHF